MIVNCKFSNNLYEKIKGKFMPQIRDCDVTFIHWKKKADIIVHIIILLKVF